MNEKTAMTLREALGGNAYPGRGILLGMAGGRAVAAYFIMGRSVNSRNRVFELRDGALYTAPFDETKVKDPSLIIYRALCVSGERLIVTNGDQTDTICDGFRAGKTFEEALAERTYEPDAPNYTPRISGVYCFEGEKSAYKLGILKRGENGGTERLYYPYQPEEGIGRLIHTYVTDGDPLPSFAGEPVRVSIPSDIDEFTDLLWRALDENNKISLYVRFTDPVTGAFEDRLRNKNQN